MVSKELLEYIEHNIEQGANLGEIRHALLNEGWHVDEVEHAMRSTRKEAKRFAVPSVKKNFFFLTLLIFVTLAVILVLLTQQRGPITCADEECVLNAVSECKLAVGEMSFSQQQEYFRADSVYEIEVRGQYGDECLVKFDLESVTLESNEAFISYADEFEMNESVRESLLLGWSTSWKRHEGSSRVCSFSDDISLFSSFDGLIGSFPEECRGN